MIIQEKKFVRGKKFGPWMPADRENSEFERTAHQKLGGLNFPSGRTCDVFSLELFRVVSMSDTVIFFATAHRRLAVH